jgi:murein DD-endopeptidase MepM/ murein hydrolase activator NlpD
MQGTSCKEWLAQLIERGALRANRQRSSSKAAVVTFVSGLVVAGAFGVLTRGHASESAGAAPPVSSADYALLERRRLQIPVAGITAGNLVDTFSEARSEGRRHDALDIPASRGTPVIAADNGSVEKLFASKLGGLTVYQFDSTATYCYYYAHLQRYAGALREGQLLRRGDTIGYVGTSGDAPANAPHLHFAIFKLGPERRWWEGTALNPYPVLTEHAGK